MINKTINLLIALMLFAVLFLAIDNSFTDLAKKEEITQISIEEIAGGMNIKGETIRYGIFSDFIFPFELLSLLLLASLIGALYIAKKEA
jgi:NADH:ubiquinone oxidoreductase subunit 6 (subunit J)